MVQWHYLAYDSVYFGIPLFSASHWPAIKVINAPTADSIKIKIYYEQHKAYNIIIRKFGGYIYYWYVSKKVPNFQLPTALIHQNIKYITRQLYTCTIIPCIHQTSLFSMVERSRITMKKIGLTCLFKSS